MCGIAGWYCFSDARPDTSVVRGLLLAQEVRGRSAAGAAWLNSEGVIQIMKNKGTATELARDIDSAESWAEITASPRGLLHARATTKGSEDNNENNHPVFGHGWVVVHNGVVNNDDDLFAYYSPKERFAEVDTASIALVLGQGKDGDMLDSAQHLTLLGGNATIAGWNTRHTDQMLLSRIGYNELYLTLDPYKRILYWTSADAGCRETSPLVVGKLQFLTVSKLPNETVMILRPNYKEVELWDMSRSVYSARPFRHAPRVVTGYQGSGQSNAAASASGSSNSEGSSGSSEASGPAAIALPAGNAGSSGSNYRDKLAKRVMFNRYAKTMRPLPLSEAFSLEKFDWYKHEPRLIFERFNTNHSLHSIPVPTPYGMWFFARDFKSGEVGRSFSPRKSVRELWDKNNYGALNVDKALPIADTDRTFDHIEVYEEVKIQVQRSLALPNLFDVETGLCCPWCGFIARNSLWRTFQFRCFMCSIASSVPTSKDTVIPVLPMEG